MGLIAAIITVVTSISSAKKRKKAKQEAARRRDEALGLEIRSTNSAQDIPVLYGYTATSGIPVWAGTSNTFPVSGGTLPRTGKLPRGNSGSRNEYLAQQHVISLGQGLSVLDMWTDGQRPDAPYITRTSWGEVRDDNTASSAAAHFLADRSTATFDGMTYATTVHKLNREEPQYSGPPTPLFFCKGRTVRPINRAGSVGNYVYTLGPATFSSNAILILLDYMLSDFGPNWLWAQDIDQESFYNASVIAGQVVQSSTGLTGTVFGAQDPYPYQFTNPGGTLIPEGLGTYADAYLALGIDARNGYQDNKKKYPTADLTRNVMRYEFNGHISTGSDWQDNLTKILDVVPGGEIFRTVEGKWKVVVPDSMTANSTQVVGTVSEDDLLSSVEVSYPDTTERLNQMDLEFSNINKDFSQDTVNFPAFSNETTSLYQALRSRDQNRRLGRKVRVPGIADEYHANSWASNTIRISRRTFYTFTTRPSGFLYEPGDVIRLVDTLAGVDKNVRVSETQVRGDLSVTITAVEFNKDDYGWDPLKYGTVTDQAVLATNIAAPVAVAATFNASDHSVTVSWTPSTSEDITVDSYVVERRIGASGPWLAVAEVIRDTNQVSLYPGLSSTTLTYRVRSKTSQNALSSPSTSTAVVRVSEYTPPSSDVAETAGLKVIYRTGNLPSSVPTPTRGELGRAPLEGDTAVVRYSNGSTAFRYSGGRWSVVTDLFSADTIIADNLSSISADLGTVTAGSIDATNVTVQNLTVANVAGGFTTLSARAEASDLAYSQRPNATPGVQTLPTIAADTTPYAPLITVTTTVSLAALSSGEGLHIALQTNTGMVQSGVNLGASRTRVAAMQASSQHPFATPAQLGLPSNTRAQVGDLIGISSAIYRVANRRSLPGQVVLDVVNLNGTPVFSIPPAGTYRTFGGGSSAWQTLGESNISYRSPVAGSTRTIRHSSVTLTGSTPSRQTRALQLRLLFTAVGAAGAQPGSTTPNAIRNLTTGYGSYNTSYTLVKAR